MRVFRRVSQADIDSTRASSRSTYRPAGIAEAASAGGTAGYALSRGFLYRKAHDWSIEIKLVEAACVPGRGESGAKAIVFRSRQRAALRHATASRGRRPARGSRLQCHWPAGFDHVREARKPLTATPIDVVSAVISIAWAFLAPRAARRQFTTASWLLSCLHSMSRHLLVSIAMSPRRYDSVKCSHAGWPHAVGEVRALLSRTPACRNNASFLVRSPARFHWQPKSARLTPS